MAGFRLFSEALEIAG